MHKTRLLLVNVGFHTRICPLVTPPYGLLSLAAYLRHRFPMEIRIINQRLHNTPSPSIVKEAQDFCPDIIGLSAFTTSAYLLPDFCEQLRRVLPKALLMLGGPHASASQCEAMEMSPVDILVPGEGEIAVASIVQAFREGGGYDHIPGLIIRKPHGEIVRNPGDLELVTDLDQIPLPAYDLIDLPRYWKVQSIAPVLRRRYASLVSSRGCPYHCIWCHQIFGKKIRSCSPEWILEKIRYLSRQYHIHDFEFLDDNFNFHPSRVARFCELIHQENLKIKFAFPNGLRADLLTPTITDALVDAGMYQASFALETGSPRLQHFTCKSLDIPKLLEVGRHATSRHVYCNIFCMLGFPTETEQEIRQTIDVACESPFHTASFYTVTPFPGTPLYDYVKKTNPEKLAAIRYDDMDFAGMRVNLTDMPDELLFHYQRMAVRRFFSNPGRLLRLVRSHPQPFLLPAYLPIFLYRATKGIRTGR